MLEPVTTNWVITWGLVSSTGAVSELVVVVVVVVWACREKAAQAPRRAPNMAFGFHNGCICVTGYVCLKPPQRRGACLLCPIQGPRASHAHTSATNRRENTANPRKFGTQNTAVCRLARFRRHSPCLRRRS